MAPQKRGIVTNKVEISFSEFTLAVLLRKICSVSIQPGKFSTWFYISWCFFCFLVAWQRFKLSKIWKLRNGFPPWQGKQLSLAQIKLFDRARRIVQIECFDWLSWFCRIISLLVPVVPWYRPCFLCLGLIVFSDNSKMNIHQCEKINSPSNAWKFNLDTDGTFQYKGKCLTRPNDKDKPVGPLTIEGISKISSLNAQFLVDCRPGDEFQLWEVNEEAVL